ncbi:MAG TPA: UdgX family uracil-DNA binding protein [Trueperaceae bacterium]
MTASDYPGAEEFVPERASMEAMRAAVQGCRGCPLYRDATQAVFGEGLVRSRLMLVGEIPGNDEDLQGKPFVGPAGRLLDRALEAAGIDRGETYLTNVVKHFKWKPRGKRRLHRTPNQREIDACLPWLDAEIERIKPRILVAMGATAAKTLFGPKHRVSKQHGDLVAFDRADFATSTLHPSAILRKREGSERREEMERFVADLRKVWGLLES